MNLKPLYDRVIVKADEAEEKTASGLILADTAKEKPTRGTVVAVGEGKWDEDGEKRIPLDVKVGDTVIYSKYGGDRGQERRRGVPHPSRHRHLRDRRRLVTARPASVSVH